MDSMAVSRREFLRRSGLMAAGIAAVPLAGCASGWALGQNVGRDTNLLVTGDIHYDLPGDHNMDWIREIKLEREIDVYSKATQQSFKPLMATLKKQALAVNPPAQALIQLGDLQEGMAGSPELAAELTRHSLQAIQAPGLPLPWVLVQGNHGLQGPGAREAYAAQVIPFLQRTLDPAITSMNYSYRVGDAQIVALDPFNDQEGFIDFLAAELESSTARYKLVALHEPVVPISCLCWHALMRTEDYQKTRQRLLEILARHRAIVLCGHIHKYSVLRRMTDYGPIVQVMVYSVLREDNPKPPYTRVTEYGPSIKAGREWRPETLDQRLAMLAEESKYVTDFFSCDVAGYAMLSLGGGDEDKVELRYYEGLKTEPFETIDLAAMQRTAIA